MNDLLWIHHRKLIVGAAAAVALACYSARGCIPAVSELDGRVTSGGKSVRWGTVTVIGSDNRVYTAPIRLDGTYRFDRLPPGPPRGMSVTSPSPHDHIGQNPALVGLPGSAVPGLGGIYTPSADRGAALVVKGSPLKGGAGGKESKADPREAVGVDEEGHPPPAITTPAGAPSQGRWVPIPGKYGNPLTSGLVPPIAPGPNQFNLSLD